MSQNPKKSYLLPEWKEEDYRQMNEWLQRHWITEVEFLIPDLTGIARGKIMPADKLLRIVKIIYFFKGRCLEIA
ncbi:MAG: hypothetical protein CMN54_05180 [SAR324 cluster bacterium]|uniref:Glutamine synthetase n=1 Tax=SAR324 cluster bacterium TaxID=2024889 RepID=A0A2D6YI34_9DELT|nr:hypothetical protein [SAR324 cluster bacterium]